MWSASGVWLPDVLGGVPNKLSNVTVAIAPAPSSACIIMIVSIKRVSPPGSETFRPLKVIYHLALHWNSLSRHSSDPGIRRERYGHITVDGQDQPGKIMGLYHAVIPQDIAFVCERPYGTRASTCHDRNPIPPRWRVLPGESDNQDRRSVPSNHSTFTETRFLSLITREAFSRCLTSDIQGPPKIDGKVGRVGPTKSLCTLTIHTIWARDPPSRILSLLTHAVCDNRFRGTTKLAYPVPPSGGGNSARD